MTKKQIKASLPPGVLPMSQERSQEILRHAKNNPLVKVCRTKEELEEYTTDLLKKWKLIWEILFLHCNRYFITLKVLLRGLFWIIFHISYRFA